MSLHMPPWFGKDTGTSPCDKCGVLGKSFAWHDNCPGHKPDATEIRSSDTVICPYCYHQHDQGDHWEEQEGIIDCDNCEKKFKVNIWVETHYDTKRLEEKEENEHF